MAMGMTSEVKPELANRNISVQFTDLTLNDAVRKIFQGQPLNYFVIQGKGIHVTELVVGGPATSRHHLLLPTRNRWLCRQIRLLSRFPRLRFSLEHHPSVGSRIRMLNSSRRLRFSEHGRRIPISSHRIRSTTFREEQP